MCSPEYYLKKCLEAEEDKRTFKAIEYLQLALAIDSMDAFLWVRLGYFQKEVELFDAALDSFKRAIELDANQPLAYTGMGAVAADTGDYETAEECFQKSIDLKPLACRYVFLGDVQHRLNKIEKAECSFLEALRIDPEYEEAMYNLAHLLRDKGKEQVAISLFKKAIEIDPDYAAAYRELGFSLRGMGELEEAERLLRIAVTLDESDHWTHLYLAELLENQDKTVEAEQEILHAYELAPTEPLPRIMLGNLYTSQGKKTEAEQNYRYAVDLNSDDAQSCFKLAQFLIDNDEVDEGAQWLDKALKIEPDHEKARLLREMLPKPDEPPC